MDNKDLKLGNYYYVTNTNFLMKSLSEKNECYSKINLLNIPLRLIELKCYDEIEDYIIDLKNKYEKPYIVILVDEKSEIVVCNSSECISKYPYFYKNNVVPIFFNCIMQSERMKKIINDFCQNYKEVKEFIKKTHIGGYKL